MERIPEPVPDESIFNKTGQFVLLLLVSVILSVLIAFLFVYLGIMDYIAYLYTVTLLITIVFFVLIVIREKIT